MSESALLSIEIESVGPRGGSKKHTLKFKTFNEVPIGIVRKNRHDIYVQAVSILEWALTPDDLEIFDNLPQTKFWDAFREMQKVSQIDVGESSASPES